MADAAGVESELMLGGELAGCGAGDGWVEALRTLAGELNGVAARDAVACVAGSVETPNRREAAAK
jgi:hypothetical protein